MLPIRCRFKTYKTPPTSVGLRDRPSTTAARARLDVAEEETTQREAHEQEEDTLCYGVSADNDICGDALGHQPLLWCLPMSVDPRLIVNIDEFFCKLDEKHKWTWTRYDKKVATRHQTAPSLYISRRLHYGWEAMPAHVAWQDRRGTHTLQTVSWILIFASSSKCTELSRIFKISIHGLSLKKTMEMKRIRKKVIW